jgi:hypothetical protein
MERVMPNDVRPYFVPSPHTVTWLPWNLVEGESQVLLPGCIEGWEPGTNLRLNREFQVDVERFESETQSSVGDFSVNVSWQSSTTDMVDSAVPLLVPPTGAGVVEVELIGSKVGGILSLRSRIVLAQRPRGDVPIGAPRMPGSIVVEDDQLLVLERAATMFPVQMVDFARTTYAPNASWHLDVDGDLEAPFMGAVLLQINSRDTDLREAISHQGTMDDFQRVLNDEFEADVAALMIDLAVENRDDLLANEWPVDSVADVLKNTLLRANLADAVPPSAHNLVDFRTQVAGAVRKMGHGRLFR